MACPFDEAYNRHPTPPLSPSTSSGSSRGSSAPSLSPSHLSSLLPRDINKLHPTFPDSQLLKHRDSTATLGLMSDGHDHDPMILDDDWEEEKCERPERGQGEHILEISPFFQISTRRGATHVRRGKLVKVCSVSRHDRGLHTRKYVTLGI
jgi:hypothetical protein